VSPPQAREQIGLALKRGAPGSDIDSTGRDADLRDALDLDSLGFLKLVENLYASCLRGDLPATGLNLRAWA
jgi:hypothetical protein